MRELFGFRQWPFRPIESSEGGELTWALLFSMTELLTAIEAFRGQLFLAVFIARLVALHTALGLKKN